MTHPQPRLFVCYIPALDRRRVSASVTPFVHRLLADYPSVGLRTQPTTELFPTLVTGTNPDTHQIWQVSLKDRISETWADRLLDHLPDWLTTTYQCVRHFFDSAYELPAIPRRRRRHFNLHRLKYTRRDNETDVVNVIGGVPSLFGLLGREARYRLAADFKQIPKLLDTLPDNRYTLDMLEFYAFDLLCHWNLDRPRMIDERLRLVDDFVRDAFQRCRQKGVTMILLVDHGQEAVAGSIDLKKLLKAIAVPPEEYHYFIDVAVARFWFKSEPARQAISQMLEMAPQIIVRTNEQLREYNIFFDDDRFGEIYAIAEHGHIFFPNDFYQPLANLYLALTKPAMRPRLFDPRVRGYHGHLPDHPAEEGFVVLADPYYKADIDWMRLIDFAPTVLDLLGRDKPDVMGGRPVFSRKKTRIN